MAAGTLDGHQANLRDPANVWGTPGTQGTLTQPRESANMMTPRRFGFAGPGPASWVTSPSRAPDEADPPKPWDPPWRSRTAHRSCDPEAAAVLMNARRTRGWSVSEAARRSGVSRRMIGMLEGAQRRPSVSTAEALIDAYRLTGDDAETVRSIAIPLVGRDSPFNTGIEPGGW